MELLLNLAWALLALPGYWLWRRSACGRRTRNITALQSLLALGCVLFLLFPVVSASDDLHAMRAEMEDSATNKRTVRQAGSEKHSGWVNRLQSPPATVARAVRLDAPEVGLLQVSVRRASPLDGPGILRAGRAPPVSLLG